MRKQHNVMNLVPRGVVKTTKLTPEHAIKSLTNDAIRQIGTTKYEQEYAATLDTAENKGRFFVLDVETNEHEIGDNLIAVLKCAKTRDMHNLYVRRIGYRAVLRLH